MFNVSIKSNFEQIVLKMSGFSRNQLLYVLATALTKTAQEIARAERKELQYVFDSPTPYTLDCLYVKSACKAQLSVYVRIKDFSAKGTPAIKFLSAQINGGKRHQKRFERTLQAVGALP
ncbi:hypothetical protein [Undibacterium sp. TJN19]|uniref:hypothetical protein n=1 Tax=Undibacterium sp. TJN19 TaxID=3413055 RepID=UPI003BF0B8AA